MSEGDKSAWPLLAPLAALIAGWVVMAWPWLSGRATIPWDAKAQFLPQIQFLAQSFARGDSPFWNPYAFSGQNQIADPQSMIFSPPFLLLALVNGNPSAWAVDIATLLAALGGAVALLVWFRDRRWHWAGGIIAGLAFCFGASMAWRVQHIGQVLSLAYWPMALLALDRLLDRRSTRQTWAAALALGIIGAVILLGRDQVALLVLYLLAAQAVWRIASHARPWQHLKSILLPLLLAGATAIALAIVPLTLTMLMAADSNRPSIDFEGAGRGSLHPALLITALFPQLFGAAFRMEDYWGPPSFAWADTGLFIAQNMGQIYIGAVPLLLIVMAAVRGHLWAREVRFFTLALGLVTLYALGWYTPVFRFFYTLLPGVGFYRRPADATFVMGALGAVLAGYAVHRLFEKTWDRPTREAWGAIGTLVLLTTLLALVLGLKLDRAALLPYPLLAAAIAFGTAVAAIALALPRRTLEPWAAAGLLAGVTTLDLAWNNGPSTSSALPPPHYDVLDPASRNPVIAVLREKVAANQNATHRDRVELLGLGFHWPNASMTHRLENTLGYNPVRQQLYARATGAEDTVGLPEQRKFTKLLPSYSSELVNQLGLRYVASSAPLGKVDPALNRDQWRLTTQAPGVSIYENSSARPRVSFARRVVAANFETMLTTGQWPAFEPSNDVVLEHAAGTYFSTGGALAAPQNSVRIADYRNTSVVIDSTSSTGGYVVLNDLWHPWWFATVDGREARVERANVLFRAVEVPPGKHVVRFEFRPFRGAWLNVAERSGLQWPQRAQPRPGS